LKEFFFSPLDMALNWRTRPEINRGKQIAYKGFKKIIIRDGTYPKLSISAILDTNDTSSIK
jgi:hypothetical protein